jgi:hypothetical protein
VELMATMLNSVTPALGHLFAVVVVIAVVLLLWVVGEVRLCLRVRRRVAELSGMADLNEASIARPRPNRDDDRDTDRNDRAPTRPLDNHAPAGEQPGPARRCQISLDGRSTR